MMNTVDSILSQAYSENPIQGALLGVLLDGGKVVSIGETSENLLTLVPGLVYFEKRSVEELSELNNLTERDLVFVEGLSVDQLWSLSQTTGAQLALISDKPLEPTLVDFQIQDKDLRSALLGLGNLWKQIQNLSENFYLDGQRDQAGLFLDRDGVVVEDVEYLHDPERVRLRSDVVQSIRKAREMNFRVFIITNQSGLGRGMFSVEQYEQVTFRIQELLAKEGLFVDRILKAPFYEKSILAAGLVRRSLRKPRPGMIHSIVREFRIDVSKSILVGDSATDLMSGALAGIGQIHLLKSPRTPVEIKKWREWPLISRAKVDLKKIEISSLEEIFS